MMRDVPSVVFDFLSRLPKTIQQDILAQVVLYAAREPIGRTDENFPEMMRRFLLEQTSGHRATSAILCTVAVLDHVIARSAIDSRQSETFVRPLIKDIPALEPHLLGLPMRQRHFEQALADWNALRATLITAQTLRDFEALGGRHQKEESNGI